MVCDISEGGTQVLSCLLGPLGAQNSSVRWILEAVWQHWKGDETWHLSWFLVENSGC